MTKSKVFLAWHERKPLLVVSSLVALDGAATSHYWLCSHMVCFAVHRSFEMYSRVDYWVAGGSLVSQGVISVGELTSLLVYTVYVGSGLQMLTYVLTYI